MENKNALIIMLKNPIKGKVKTRLAEAVGDDKALDIYLKLLHHTKKVTENIDADKFIFYSDVVDRNDLFDTAKYKKYAQCSGNLGVRMDYAFSIPFKNEYKQVVMVGSDCYDLNSSHIDAAYSALNENDFVIGPANDGGYYLIGMKKWNRWVLENKSWSTPILFKETISDIESRNGKVLLLEPLTDIDTITDLNNYPELNDIKKQ